MRSLVLAVALTLLFAVSSAAAEMKAGAVNDWSICSGPTCEMGVSAHVTAKEHGVTVIRYALYWSRINPAPNVFDFAQADREIDAARAAGMDVYVNLSTAPAWASAGQPTYLPFTEGCSTAYTTPEGSVGVKFDDTKSYCVNPPSIDQSALKAMWKRTVERYKGKVKYYGVWNEPNYDLFYPPRVMKRGIRRMDDQRLIDELLRPSYAAIKAADQYALVVGPEMDDVGEYREVMVREKALGERWFDILAFHMYAWSENYPADALVRLREGFLPVSREFASGRPIWITETGSFRCKATDVNCLTKQGTAMKQVLPELTREGDIAVVIFYNLRKSDTESYADYGLVKKNDTPTPALVELKRWLFRRRRPVRRDISPRSAPTVIHSNQ